jgi:hypothetical protein
VERLSPVAPDEEEFRISSPCHGATAGDWRGYAPDGNQKPGPGIFDVWDSTIFIGRGGASVRSRATLMIPSASSIFLNRCCITMTASSTFLFPGCIVCSIADFPIAFSFWFAGIP